MTTDLQSAVQSGFRNCTTAGTRHSSSSASKSSLYESCLIVCILRYSIQSRTLQDALTRPRCCCEQSARYQVEVKRPPRAGEITLGRGLDVLSMGLDA